MQLRWTFKADKETLDRPVLEQAQLEGVRESPILWTVHVPTGYRLSMEGRGGTLAPLPATGAGQELRRAAVQLRLLELLGQRARDGGDTSAAGQIWTAQQRFETFCRQAEHQLALPAGGVAEAGPDGQPPAQWLQALRERYRVLARTLDLDKIRTEATHGRTATQTPSAAAAGMEIAASGLPRYWQGAAGASVPRLHLTPTQSRQARQSWLLSGGLVLLLLASWGLAQVAKVKAWPEQLALLGCLGWLVFGAGWGALFLVLTAAGVGVRVAVLLRWGMSWLRQRFPRTAASSP